MSNRKSLSAIAPLFLVLFIDGMGLSLLFPVLNAIIIDNHSNFLPAATTLATRDFLYGLTVGIFMICWFFGAAILGDLSDTVGRKKALLVCLIGSFLGYLLSAFAVGIHSLTFLILGRVIAGFTAGSQPIAQAAIVDVSSEAHKARNIGLILLAISLGFIIGPIIGGVLSDSQFVSWFGFSTPLYFASLISLINAFLLGWLFDETFQRTKKINIKLQHAVDIFMSAFKHKKVRKLSIVLLVMIYGWSNFFSFIAMFVLHRYGFTPLKISLLLADMGIGFSIGCAYLVDRFVKYFNLKSIITISFFLTAIFILLIIVTHQAVYLWGLMIAVGTAIAVGYSAIITLFSNQVSRDEQGWVGNGRHWRDYGTLLRSNLVFNRLFSKLWRQCSSHFSGNWHGNERYFNEHD
ncbi:MFS transporter [Coxiella burnetii]|uniref:MFS transporter n=1 Tax=Coxiella burnetii TaxID=777 RepID=UPI0000DADDC9|nr:MFS transporter [Coxiella burnetii]